MKYVYILLVDLARLKFSPEAKEICVQYFLSLDEDKCRKQIKL
jgi:hypothetical protein